MPLNTSDAIKLGTNTIDKIYLGSNVVYTVSGEKFATVNLASTSALAVRNIVFEMLVESPVIPVFQNVVGGTLVITEETTGVWRVTSVDVITECRFYWSGLEPDTNITKVIVIKGDTLTTIYASYIGLGVMTYFEWQGACNATNASNTWSMCYSLEEIILPDLSNVTNFNRTLSLCEALVYLGTIDTSSGEVFTEMLNGSDALVCLTNIDTTNQTDTTDMFLGCTSLLAPDATDQVAILAGTNWINPSSCVNASVPPIYNLTEVLIDG